MARLSRYLQKIFGSTAGGTQIAQFGSLAAGSPAFTTNPATIQALGNYLQGWFGAVEGENSPAIEDVNALEYLTSYQLAYLFQAGVAEWQTDTVYYKGSLVNNGNGLVYLSLTDNNSGNAVTDATNWRLILGPSADQVVVGSAPYCTHATLAAAVADSAVGTNVLVVLTEDYTVNSTINLTKAGWRIRALPGVTYTKGSAGTGISCQAARIEIERLKLSGFSTAGNKAITGTSAWQYGRVLFCNFLNCDTEVDDSSVAGGKKPVTLGNISE